jgi:plastocyanin
MLLHMRKRAAVTGLMMLTISITAAACSRGSGDESPPTTTARATASQPPTTSAGPAGVVVQQVNFSFDPSQVTVAEGDTVTIMNTTPSTPHTFTVNGQNIDVDVAPSGSEEVTIDLPPGSYPFECRFHAASGMKGTLEVT